MTGEIKPCDRCGGRKHLFLEKRPAILAIAAVLGIAVLALNVFIAGGFTRLGLALAVVVMGIIGISLVRIRCLRCEPSWKKKAWGLGQG